MRKAFWLHGLFVLLLLIANLAQAKDYGDIQQQRIHPVLSAVDSISEPDGPFELRKLSAAGKVVGYVFQSLDGVNISAYSGKPINVQVILDPAPSAVSSWSINCPNPTWNGHYPAPSNWRPPRSPAGRCG
ncbi:transcriptional regulator of nitric oxide reductase [Pseudomonas sp. R151218B TE3479]